MSDRVLPLFTLWETTLKDLLQRTAKFPKTVRFTFSGRIDNLALDVYERIVEARYSKKPGPALQAASLDIEKMRLLLRVCHDLAYLDHRGYEHVARNLDEAGRMIGGWLKHPAPP